jgi:small-conductance mechanosensitive channel
MRHQMRYRLTQFYWQLGLSLVTTALFGLCLWKSNATGIDIAALDRSTFVESLSAIASILALFCSVSFAFVLFVSQSNNAERVAAFDQLKARLLSTQQWLLSHPKDEDREVCMALVFELDKLDLSDLPQTDYGPQYHDYITALGKGLDDPNEKRRQFFLTSFLYIGYIEQLLNRIGLVSIRQIITKSFIDMLVKGVGIICISIAVLISAAIWYSETTKPAFVLASTFCGVFSIFLFYEFRCDIYREYNEELNFLGPSDDGEES